MKHIRIDMLTPENKHFLYDTTQSDSDVGLFYMNDVEGYYTYEVIDEQLFMLAVLKHGIKYEVL
jgi:hypothetical protein